MSLLIRRHDPDEYDGRDVDDDGDGVLDEVVDGVGDSAEDAEDEDGGWWIFNCSRREVVELLVVTVVIVVVSAALGTGLYQLFGRPDREEWARPGETSPAVAHSHQAQESATPTPAASLSAQEQALRDAALSTPKPERPAGMDELSPEGLRLAGEYFLSLHPYVYATGDLEPWQAMSDPECRFCSNVVDNVTNLHSYGGWRDPWPQEVVAESYGVSDEDPNVWAVSFHFSHHEGTDHDGSGGTSPVKAEDITFVLQMRWTGQTWITEKGQSR